MKTIFLLTSFLFAPFISHAQQETLHELVKRISSSDFSWNLNYAEDGLLTNICDSSNNNLLLWSYDYYASQDETPFIRQCSYFQPNDNFNYIDGEFTFYRESVFNSGGLISADKNMNTFMWSVGENFEYEYTNGRMTKITGSLGVIVELLWSDGNLTQIIYKENNEEVGNITCSYSNQPAEGICQAFNSPLLQLLNYYSILSLGPLVHGYYGELSCNLLTKMTISFNESFIENHSGGILKASYYPIVKLNTKTYEYEINPLNKVTKISVTDEDCKMDYLLDYGDNDSCITNCSKNYMYSHSLCTPLDLQGRRLTGKPSKGVYIQDGKKRVMK